MRNAIVAVLAGADEVVSVGEIYEGVCARFEGFVPSRVHVRGYSSYRARTGKPLFARKGCGRYRLPAKDR